MFTPPQRRYALSFSPSLRVKTSVCNEQLTRRQHGSGAQLGLGVGQEEGKVTRSFLRVGSQAEAGQAPGCAAGLRVCRPTALAPFLQLHRTAMASQQHKEILAWPSI